MRRFLSKLFSFTIMTILLAPSLALAAGPKAEPLVVVADTRNFTGWEAWWTNLYNESHFWFTVVTVITIPIVGLLFGIITDFIMARIGIDLSSRELAEH